MVGIAVGVASRPTLRQTALVVDRKARLKDRVESKKAEIDDLLGGDAPVFNAFFGITEEGNWEQGNNVLHQHKTAMEVAEQYGISASSVVEILNKSKPILFDYRAKRERPITDDKVLTSWNALTISALAAACRTFDEPSFLERAEKAGAYLREHCVDADGKVYRMVRPGANIPGFLDDYSLLAQAFVDLYQATFDEQWLAAAKKITVYAMQHFFDGNTGMFFYADPEEGGTITNKTETSDNVIPSSNSVMAKVLYLLSYYFGQREYLEKSDRMLNNVVQRLEQHPRYYANWGLLLCDFVFNPPEVVFTGKAAQNLRQEFDRLYLYALVAGSENPSDMPLLKQRVTQESLIYVCRNNVCKLPVKTLEEAIEQF
jgi:uncharacterized protein YyaL (SSP411 family)